MRVIRRLPIVAALAMALGVGWLPTMAAHAVAGPATFSIGIDNVSPPGHNFEYIDYYPHSGVNVHNGDTVNFSWNQGSPDGFHTATVLPIGLSPAQEWQNNPFVVPDSDDGPNAIPLQNQTVFNPTNPPPGSGPGACGDAATPCPFDGSGVLSSGANGGGSTFALKLSLPSGATGTYDVVCLIHPGMHMQFSVVSPDFPTSSASDLASAAATQYQNDTATALNTVAGVKSSSITNADGSHTITAYAGVASPNVLVDEMLPAALAVKPGDHVNWIVSQNNIHTVTFPNGPAANSVDPTSSGECETASGPEPTLSSGPPTFGCAGGGAAAEFQFNPFPQGPTSIRNGGYRITTTDGGVLTYGNAPYLGSASQFHPTSPVVGIGLTGPGGYWQATADGSVFSFGDATFFGSAAGKITAPIATILTGGTGGGYALIGSDGKGYYFGQVASFGLPAQLTPTHLAAPIVGGAVDRNANGPAAWLVAADGGVFAAGPAPFLGSAGKLHLTKPIVGMATTPDGGGYWLVASDGGVFTYGDAPFLGSLGATHLNAPITGIESSDDGQGYYLVAADGGVFNYGDARFAGSAGGLHLVAPASAISVAAGTVASSGILTQPPAGPGPGNYTFTFPEAGTFTYACRIHFHMTGVIGVG